jgi:hypothetical protein
VEARRGECARRRRGLLRVIRILRVDGVRQQILETPLFAFFLCNSGGKSSVYYVLFFRSRSLVRSRLLLSVLLSLPTTAFCPRLCFHPTSSLRLLFNRPTPAYTPSHAMVHIVPISPALPSLASWLIRKQYRSNH